LWANLQCVEGSSKSAGEGGQSGGKSRTGGQAASGTRASGSPGGPVLRMERVETPHNIEPAEATP
jgi:hypothetical protein